MLDHSQTTVSTLWQTAIVLVGPPASGKTTIRQLCADYGIPGFDLATVRDKMEDESGQTDLIATTLESDAYDDSVVVIEGAISSVECETIADHVDAVLTVKIDSPREERLSRYVHREVDMLPGETASADAIDTAREQARRQTKRERPYPDHDVVIRHTASSTLTDITRRVSNLVAAVSHSQCDAFAQADSNETVSEETDTKSEKTPVSEIVKDSHLDPYAGK